MRFLHTADWQIGMKASAYGEAASRIRGERLSAAKRVIEVAQNHKVDFILVAGDIFEDNGVDRGLIQRVVDTLNIFNGPVFIIPGNHDPLVPGSVWEHPAWKSASNVLILREDKPIGIPGGFLYPCPIRERHSGRNPLAWIAAEKSQFIRVGLAHGTVEGIRQDEPDYPIPRDAAKTAGLDYLALGHWHSSATYAGSDQAVHMAYSGTHETTKFGERDSGNVLIVEISAADAPPSITPVRTAGISWIMLEKDIRERGEFAFVRGQIESIANPDNALIDINLTGILMADERSELNHIEDILSSRFLWGRLDVSRLRLSPEDETWIKSLPAGIIQEAAIRLRDNPALVPEASARALIELYSLMREIEQ